MARYYDFETPLINFIISPSPDARDKSSMELFKKEINKHNCLAIVRVCSDLLYTQNDMFACKIHELKIEDGSFPDSQIIEKFIDIINSIIIVNNKETENYTKPCICIHCRAGLGRSPVFLAIALMNFTEYDDYSDIVKLIRDKIKGSINLNQLIGLSKYKPKEKQKKCMCSIM